MNIMDYIKPELIPVALACYILGAALKATTLVKDKYIPLFLGGFSVLVCAVYVCATSSLLVPQDWLLALFTAVVQGILLAGASTYVNQLLKQSGKSE
jgi:hypothetical protein